MTIHISHPLSSTSSPPSQNICCSVFVLVPINNTIIIKICLPSFFYVISLYTLKDWEVGLPITCLYIYMFSEVMFLMTQFLIFLFIPTYLFLVIKNLIFPLCLFHKMRELIHCYCPLLVLYTQAFICCHSFYNRRIYWCSVVTAPFSPL